MLNKNTRIKVKNRSTGSIGYAVPDLGNLRRRFVSGEIKEVTFDELQKLSYTPGGNYMLKNYLVIMDNNEAVQALIGGVELEYNYSKEDIKNLLLNGSMDELLDCLDFAPVGVIDLVKQIAVGIELNDLQKRQAILNKTGFSVDNAIKIKNEAKEAAEENLSTGARRVQNNTINAAPAQERRAVTKK